jgi:hypothetical protein
VAALEASEVERARLDACADALLSWEIEAVQLDRGPFLGELVRARSPAALLSDRRQFRELPSETMSAGNSLR